MKTVCPKCASERIETCDRAMKAGGAIGFVGGAASGVAGALAGSRTGAIVGVVAGPVGVAVGSIAGAIIGGLMGGAAGGVTGAQLGQVIDERILDNYRCLACGYRFNCRPLLHGTESSPPIDF